MRPLRPLLAGALAILLLATAAPPAALPGAAPPAPTALDGFVSIDFTGRTEVDLYAGIQSDGHTRLRGNLYRPGAALTTLGPTTSADALVITYTDSDLVPGTVYTYTLELYYYDEVQEHWLPAGTRTATTTANRVQGNLRRSRTWTGGPWSLVGLVYASAGTQLTIAPGATVENLGYGYIGLGPKARLVAANATLLAGVSLSKDSRLEVNGGTLGSVGNVDAANPGYASIRGCQVRGTLGSSAAPLPVVAFEGNGGLDCALYLRPSGGTRLGGNQMPTCDAEVWTDAAQSRLDIEANEFHDLVLHVGAPQPSLRVAGNTLGGMIRVAPGRTPVTIEHNTASGIVVTGPTSGTVVIRANTLAPDAYGMAGVGLTGPCVGVVVKGNSIACKETFEATSGVALGDGPSNIQVLDNTISGCRDGIVLSGWYTTVHDNRVQGNTIHPAGGNLTAGIGLYHDVVRNEILSNTITCHDSTWDDWGIELTGWMEGGYGVPMGNDVRGNIVTNCGSGLTLDESFSNVVRDNHLISNTYTIVLGGYAGYFDQNNLFYDNYFRKGPNTQSQVEPVGDCVDHDCLNTWNVPKQAGPNIVGGPYIGGNYWSDYAGLDADSDRIGDTPYYVYTGVSDSLPLMAPYIVNETGDQDDADLGDGRCDRDLDAPDDQCTLRAALQQANGSAGLEAVYFDIPLPGVPTIEPGEALPEVVDPVIVDGSTQPGSGRVELSGEAVGGTDEPGLYLLGGGSTVRGLVINRFSGPGILIESGGGNVVQGNSIGANAAGDDKPGNRGPGLRIQDSADNRIGGLDAASANLVVGNTQGGIVIEGDGAMGNRVVGNVIGVSRDGLTPLGNGGSGVIVSAHDNTIGGAETGAGNTIAWNGGDGVALIGSDAPCANNRVQGNVIYSNAGAGVTAVTGLYAVARNAILGNTIYSNQKLGIDLEDNGVTPNDANDGDTGANGLQNYPVLTELVGNRTTIAGMLYSRPGTAYRVEVFANSSCDPSGYGEGYRYLGAVTVTTGYTGTGAFTFPTSAQRDYALSLTATDPDNNTSEFSRCRGVFVEEPLYEDQDVVTGAWGDVLGTGTTDGNEVRITTYATNRGAVSEEVQVLLRDGEDGRALPGTPRLLLLPPGRTKFEHIWNTNGYAWTSDTVPHPTPRIVDLQVVGALPEGGEIQFGHHETEVVVRPKPVVLVHGWNSSADTWSAYPGFLNSAHPLWEGYAIDTMDTGSATHIGNSYLEDACQLEAYIEQVRRGDNAWHVDIVAHSKGGLISRTYIALRMAPSEPDGRPLVSHLVMLGTPNRGSMCGWLIPTGCGFPLTPTAVENLNRYVKNKKGVPFAVLAGYLLPATCQEVGPGDMVVSFVSALGLEGLSAAGRTLTLHTGMPGSQADFTDFVLPLLARGPSTAAAPAAPLGSQPGPEQEVETQLALLDYVTVPAGDTVDTAIQVGESVTLGVTLAGPAEVSATLYTPAGLSAGTIPSGGEAARQVFRTFYVGAPPSGTWQLRLENDGVADTSVSVAAWLVGSPLVVDPAVGEPDEQGQVAVSATVTYEGAPLPGLTLTAALYGLGGPTATLALLDDGAHGDGLPDDGLYANTTPPLPPDDYFVTVWAVGGGRAPRQALELPRATVGAAHVARADLSVSLLDAPDPVAIAAPLTYTVAVTNQGPSEVLDVVLTDTLPASFTWSEAASTAGSCGYAAGAVTCTLGLISGTQAVVTIVVTPTAVGSFTNTVVVGAAEYDPDVADNTATAVTVVVPRRIYLPLVVRGK